ncbi:MAG: hypothetical protein IH937_14120, partial [Acidobacteria bacterium]|nr:hypothetical protein [Acidobacteriota bacterium]
MNRLLSTILTLLISLGMGLGGLAQQGSPVSSDVLEQLVRRIESLEQTVQELRVQVQSQSASSESPSNAQRSDAAQAMVSSPAQGTPKNDRAIKISGLAFGDFYWAAASHDESLKDRNGFWFRRIYLTFDKAMTEQLDMRLRLQMNSAGDFRSDTRLNPFAKDVYLRWKVTDQHQAYLGLSATPTWNVVQDFWSYRSLEKTVLDLQRMGAPRDLGVA